MKKFLFISSVILLGTLASCNVDEWTKFSLFYDANSVFADSSNRPADLTVFTNFITVDFTEDLDLHGAKDKQVEETLIQRCEFHVEHPVNASFLFLDNLEVFLIAEGQDTLKIAEDANVFNKSSASKIIIPVVTDDDIEKHLRTGKIQYMVKYTEDKPLPGPLKFKINIKVRVDSRRFGL